jgi:anti-sigma factor RsiW
MSCDKALSVQALFDGELDAPASAEIERHLASCAECAALYDELKTTRAALREHAPYYRADIALRSRVMNALPKPERPGILAVFAARSRAFWTGALSGGAGAALATALLMLTVTAPANDALMADLASAHVRSLMGDHLIDIASSDHHTVKPWFAGHVDVSPPVTDFAAQGYPLIGGRADYVDGRTAAVIVYRRGKHVINVFAWAAHGESLPSESERKGYHVLSWRMGDLTLAAVSDAAWPEIAGLEQLIVTQAGNKSTTP